VSAKLKGIETVVKNLNREIVKIRGRSRKGLRKAVIYLRRRMDEVYPLIPISPGGGNLRGSWSTEPIGDTKNPGIRLGFTAEYAWFVHENVGSGVHWNRPGSGPKFLQARLEQDRKDILNIIADEARTK